jgi:hypothetical protein
MTDINNTIVNDDFSINDINDINLLMETKNKLEEEITELEKLAVNSNYKIFNYNISLKDILTKFNDTIKTGRISEYHSKLNEEIYKILMDTNELENKKKEYIQSLISNFRQQLHNPQFDYFSPNKDWNNITKFFGGQKIDNVNTEENEIQYNQIEEQKIKDNQNEDNKKEKLMDYINLNYNKLYNLREKLKEIEIKIELIKTEKNLQQKRNEEFDNRIQIIKNEIKVNESNLKTLNSLKSQKFYMPLISLNDRITLKEIIDALNLNKKIKPEIYDLFKKNIYSIITKNNIDIETKINLIQEIIMLYNDLLLKKSFIGGTTKKSNIKYKKSKHITRKYKK